MIEITKRRKRQNVMLCIFTQMKRMDADKTCWLNHKFVRNELIN